MKKKSHHSHFPYLIEEGVALSCSSLWKLQRKAYQDYGIDSWIKHDVPSHVTSNSLIAKQYAEIAYQFIKRFSQKNETLYFLELGSGSGKFAYYFLKELLKLTPNRNFCYILSDLSEKNVEYYKKHPFFREFFDQKLLDVAQYDPTKKEAVFLHCRQEALSTKQPLFVIANYFFDSIETDLYRVDQGKFYQGKVALYASERSNEELLEKIHPEFYFQCIQKIDPLMKEYQECSDTTFFFPKGGIKVIDSLKSLSQKGFLLLAGDKGVCDRRSCAPQIAFHSTISIPVNFYLLGKYIEEKGGRALFQKRQSEHFKVSLFTLGEKMNFDSVFKKSINAFSAQQLIDKAGSSDIFKDSNFDPFIFFAHQEKIKQELTEEEYVEAVNEVAERFFPLSKEEAALFYQLGTEKALEKALLAEQLPKNAIDLDIFLHGIDLKGEVLIIAEEEVQSQLKSRENITIVTAEKLTEIANKFDTVLLFDFNPVKREEEKLPLVVREGQKKMEMIENQYPFMKTLQYQDKDIDDFFTNLGTVKIIDPKYFVTFFYDLHERGQITLAQMEKAFARAIEKKLISEKDWKINRNKKEEREDPFFLLADLCLQKLMKVEGTFHAYVADTRLKSENEKFFNSIVIDPFLCYREEIDHRKELQQITIQKLGSS